MTLGSFSDLSLIGVAGLAVPILAQIPAGIADGATLQWGEYGIVGLTVALALWALREQSQRRLDDAKDYAQDVKLIQEARLQDSRQHHETQITLLMRLLDERKEK